MADKLDLGELRDLARGATKRPWVAFDSGDRKGATLAVMKGPRPPSVQGRFTRWPEVVAWTGFDAADVPWGQRRANLHLIIGAVNALPLLLNLIDAQQRVIAAAADALDVADGIVDTTVGTDTPPEWHRAFRAVARARAKVPA